MIKYGGRESLVFRARKGKEKRSALKAEYKHTKKKINNAERASDKGTRRRGPRKKY